MQVNLQMETVLDLISLSDILHPVQESDGELVYGGRLECDIGSVSERPYSSRVCVGLVSDVVGEEMLEPDVS